MSSLAEEPLVAGVHAQVAARFADEDEARSAYLDELVKRGGTCRGCGANVNDKGLVDHPGVCAVCFKRKKATPIELEHRPPPLRTPPAPPKIKTFTRDTPDVPAEEEETMPRGKPLVPKSCCGSKGTKHLSSCSGTGVPPPPEPKLGGAARGRKVHLVVRRLDADALLARRETLLAELADVEEQLRERLASEEAKLERMRRAIATTTAAAKSEVA